MVLPGAFDLADHGQAQRPQLPSEGGQKHEAGTGVGRVGNARRVACAFELVDDRPDGLLAHLGGARQLPEAAATRCDALEDLTWRIGRSWPCALRFASTADSIDRYGLNSSRPTRLGLRDAHLLYAGTPGEVPAAYPVIGSPVTLHVHAVDLTAAPDALEEQLGAVAAHLTPEPAGAPYGIAGQRSSA